jgi:hypothetical protein
MARLTNPLEPIVRPPHFRLVRASRRSATDSGRDRYPMLLKCLSDTLVVLVPHEYKLEL